jgi:hypothetical protein
MHVNVAPMAKILGMDFVVLNNILFPTSFPPEYTLAELEEELEDSETLAEVDFVIRHTPKDTPLHGRAFEKKYLLWKEGYLTATTIADWYELYRYARYEYQRKQAQKRIEGLFELQLAEADTLPKLLDFWESFPRKSKSLSYLKRRIIFKVAEHY